LKLSADYSKVDRDREQMSVMAHDDDDDDDQSENLMKGDGNACRCK
jgi:hypothetical protein